MLLAMRRRLQLPLVVLALLALAATLSACGDGGRPAAVASTLAPSAVGSSLPAGTPSPAATASGSAHPATSASTAATIAPSTSATPTTARVTDASIRADLTERLGASPTLVGLEIQVRVVHRVVYLFGTVKSQREKAAAERIAVTEPGIVKVVSLLSIVPGGGGY
jgi:hypothetical protein